jgi:hypothetical protein
MNRIATLLVLSCAFLLGPSLPVSDAFAAPGVANVKAKKKRARSKKKKRKVSKRQTWPVKRPKKKPKAPPELGNVPFPEGERLAFDIKIPILGDAAGEAVLAVGKRTMVGGRSVVPLVAFLRSGSFLSKLYPVDNKLVVLADERTFQPVKTDFYIRENGKSIDYHTTFDQRSRLLRSVKIKGGKTVRRNFTPATVVYEALSSVYGCRRMNLQPGLEFQYFAWDGRRERLVTVTVIGLESVWTPAGTFKAMKVDISTTVTGGFIKTKSLGGPVKKGSAWFAMDAYRTPVKLTTPTKLGEAEAVLTRRFVEKI